MTDTELVDKLHDKLTEIQRKSNECVTGAGRVLSHKRYEYNVLVSQAKAVREAILQLQDLSAKESML